MEQLHHLAAERQECLDWLMTQNNAGHLTETEREELQNLVREAEEITISNARILLAQRQRLGPTGVGAVNSAA